MAIQWHGRVEVLYSGYTDAILAPRSSVKSRAGCEASGRVVPAVGTPGRASAQLIAQSTLCKRGGPINFIVFVPGLYASQVRC